MSRTVWHDHAIVGEHPPGSTHELAPGNRLVVVEPDGRKVTYEAHQWHVCSTPEDTVTCGYAEPDPSCQRCHGDRALPRASSVGLLVP